MAPPKKAGKPNQEMIFVIGSFRVLFVNAGGKVLNYIWAFNIIILMCNVKKYLNNFGD